MRFSWGQLIACTVAALLIGVALGAKFFAPSSSPGESSAPARPTVQAAMADIPAAPASPDAPSTKNAADADNHRALPGPVDEAAASPSPHEDAGGDLAVLAARVQTLEKELTKANAQMVEAVGKPPEAPPNLPDRFKEKAVLEALQSALQQIGSTAEVTSIDCTEYPCIAYSNGLSLEQLSTLKSSPSLSVYAQDSVSVLKWNDLVGFIATPKDDPIALGSQEAKDAAEQRILFRLQQMSAASKAH